MNFILLSFIPLVLSHKKNSHCLFYNYEHLIKEMDVVLGSYNELVDFLVDRKIIFEDFTNVHTAPKVNTVHTTNINNEDDKVLLISTKELYKELKVRSITHQKYSRHFVKKKARYNSSMKDLILSVKHLYYYIMNDYSILIACISPSNMTWNIYTRDCILCTADTLLQNLKYKLTFLGIDMLFQIHTMLHALKKVAILNFVLIYKQFQNESGFKNVLHVTRTFFQKIIIESKTKYISDMLKRNQNRLQPEYKFIHNEYAMIEYLDCIWVVLRESREGNFLIHKSCEKMTFKMRHVVQCDLRKFKCVLFELNMYACDVYECFVSYEATLCSDFGKVDLAFYENDVKNFDKTI